jgi:myo-inositol-1(or 4)-monophosphatase
MNLAELRRYERGAAEAARSAGMLLRTHRRRAKLVHKELPRDLKLELDLRSQRRIARHLREVLRVPILGEEESREDPSTAEVRWVVDPIDGTVNFAQGIPHCAVSIALQERREGGFETVAAVVFDPFMDELWTAVEGGVTKLNGRRVQVSAKARLGEAIVSLGFAQSDESLSALEADFARLSRNVRKLRIMGSAALALAYVACGRFDAYVEVGVRTWDVAAGMLLVSAAGGEPGCRPLPGDHYWAVAAHNGRLALAGKR